MYLSRVAKMSYDDNSDFYAPELAEGHSVCDQCIDDRDIQEFIKSAAESLVCDFCGRRNRLHPMAAPLDEVVEFMRPSLDREFGRAINNLGWDSQEGGYQGEYWDSDELLTEVIGLSFPNDDDRLLRLLSECLGDEPWCERDPYGLRRDQWLIGSWENFCKSIKHQRRYFFLRRRTKNSLATSERLSPWELLRFISKTVGEYELIRELPEGSFVYRARQQNPGRILQSPYDFGPPPVEHATRSNRMSPAGIVMFYGSDDKRTAVAEIDDDPRCGIAVGTFRTTRPATILDLTRLPCRLRFFEQQSDSSSIDRYALIFLHSFVLSVAARVEPGRREHIDYVPTQVVTEWFRTSFRHKGSRIHGIRYPSTQRQGGASVVLFADRYDLVLSPRQIAQASAAEHEDEWFLRNLHERAWLKLVRRQFVRPAS
jgi:hypothetical protein